MKPPKFVEHLVFALDRTQVILYTYRCKTRIFQAIRSCLETPKQGDIYFVLQLRAKYTHEGTFPSDCILPKYC